MVPEERAEWDKFYDLLAKAPAGDRIEFGVLSGGTLHRMSQHQHRTFGVDSFEGMDEPSQYDIKDGINQYPKGRLAMPMSVARKNAPRAILIKGFVPAVLKDVPVGPYGFADVDLDHYKPTLDALEWLWDKMLPGGIITSDDHFAGRDWLAARAINEFAERHPLAGSVHRRAWWVK